MTTADQIPLHGRFPGQLAGGDIVIGIGERRDRNRRTGELLVKGLNEPGFDFDQERNRLTQMILKGIN